MSQRIGSMGFESWLQMGSASVAQHIILTIRLPMSHGAWLGAPSHARWTSVVGPKGTGIAIDASLGMAGRPLGKLSVGERQRVLLARVLAV